MFGLRAITTTVVAAALASACGEAVEGHDGGVPFADAARRDAASDGGIAGDAGSVDPRAPRINAILIDGEVVPVYPTADATAYVGYRLADGVLRAIDEDGTELWRGEAPPGERAILFGGFDFDEDGWPDAAVLTSSPTGATCNSAAEPVLEERITLFAGRSGATHEPAPPLTNCQTPSPAMPSYYSRWTQLSILFGDSPSLAFAPQYYGQGFFMRYAPETERWAGEPFYQPTGAWWQQSTGGAYATAYPPNSTYSNLSHVFNGLIKPIGGVTHLIAWTTQRVMNFDASAPLGPSQLLAEYPYISGCAGGPAPGPACGGTLSGRNYGLVASDPGSERVFLIAGTHALSVYDDLRTGTLCTTSASGGAKDCWGALERHVSVYLPTSNGLQDRFYSVSHDDGSGLAVDTPGEIASWYTGRVVYPANPLVRTQAGPSRIAYNVYNHAADGVAGHWVLHVSGAGGTDDAVRVVDRFLWDIRDIDDDGTDEWITSPICDPLPCPTSPGWYFPQRRIDVQTWDDAAQALVAERTLLDVLPYLAPTFRTAEASTTYGYLYPVLTVNAGGQPKMLLTRDGRIAEVEP